MTEDIVTLGPREGYRPCVGVVLFNPDGHVWMGKRNGVIEQAWQMPQGGIDKGEAPEEAALREMKEEIGTDKALLVGETQGWLSYDLPDWAQGKAWGGKWRGQTQKWYAARFTGDDTDIDIETEHPEFDAWRWVGLDEVTPLIIEFKRRVYAEVISELRPTIELALTHDWSRPIIR